MKEFIKNFIIIVPLVLSACSPGFHAEQGSAPVDVETTYQPPRPTIVKEKGYNIARGAIRIQDIAANFDKETKSMRLTGKVEYLPVNGGRSVMMNMNLAGLLDEDGFIVLKDQTAADQQKEGVTLAAKATCLSEEGSCTSSFIDVYLYTEGVVYHQQFETKEKASAKDQVDAKDSSKDQDDEEESEESEFEGGSDEVEEVGPYIGSVHDDIEKILKVKPEPEQKVAPKNTPNKEERDAISEAKRKKAEEDKKKEEEAKKKAEEKKKNDAAKKNDSKKEDVKKEEPKKSDPKKDDSDKDDDKKIPIPGKKPVEKPVETPADKPKVNKLSQAIGAVNNGRLENAVDMLKWEKENSPAGYTIIRPQRKTHYATSELAYIIQQIGKISRQMIPGYVVAIGDLSKEKGGSLGKHKSHTNGLDADIAFYFDNKSFQGFFASALAVSKPHANWMVEEQWKLYKHLVRTQFIDRIFIHKTLKKELCEMAIKSGEVTKNTNQGVAYETLRRLIADTDHNTHFHLRVKCSSSQVRCRQMAEPKAGTGCF